MPELKDSSIKELEARLMQLEIARVAIEKDLAWQQKLWQSESEAAQKALDLASETNRQHLTMLNGEGERLQAMQSTYVPRELYSSDLKELRMAIDDLRDFKNKTIGRNSVIALIVSVAVSLLFLVINLFVTKRLQ